MGKRSLFVVGFWGGFFLWGLGGDLLFDCLVFFVLNTNATLPVLPPSLTSTASNLEGIYFVPVRCCGTQSFHCIDPASLSVFTVR